jgi:hypothetical protein
MIGIEDVYTPDEIRQLHDSYGWTNYIFSSAHARQMQAAQAKLEGAAYAARVRALERGVDNPDAPLSPSESAVPPAKP